LHHDRVERSAPEDARTDLGGGDMRPRCALQPRRPVGTSTWAVLDGLNDLIEKQAARFGPRGEDVVVARHVQYGVALRQGVE
jgi:hypothetical protein